MKNNSLELYDWEDLVQKAIEAEAKASLIPLSILREMDQRIAHGKRPAKITKYFFQKAPMKDLKIKDF